MVTYNFVKCRKVSGDFVIDSSVAEVSSIPNMADGTFSVMNFWSNFLLCRNAVNTAMMSEDYYYSPSGIVEDCTYLPIDFIGAACFSSLCGLHNGSACDWVR